MAHDRHELRRSCPLEHAAWDAPDQPTGQGTRIRPTDLDFTPTRHRARSKSGSQPARHRPPGTNTTINSAKQHAPDGTALSTGPGGSKGRLASHDSEQPLQPNLKTPDIEHSRRYKIYVTSNGFRSIDDSRAFFGPQGRSPRNCIAQQGATTTFKPLAPTGRFTRSPPSTFTCIFLNPSNTVRFPPLIPMAFLYGPRASVT